MSKKKSAGKSVPLSNIILQRPAVFFALLGLTVLLALPMRTQNLKLNGLISEDAWWHFRQINEVTELGRRIDPDIYEFTTLARPMTYPPLFHFGVAFLYKIFAHHLTLIQFSHFLNIAEGLLYLLLIFLISRAITYDNLFSLLGLLAAAVSYGVVIRARTGELMPFVFADLLSLAAILLFIYVLRENDQKKNLWFSGGAGLLMGLAMLAWSGTLLIYAPMALFVFLAMAVNRPANMKEAGKIFGVFCLAFFPVWLPWYLPIVARYGLNPYHTEMSWFMQNFTVMHQTMPLSHYFFASGPGILFIPVVFFLAFVKKNSLYRFLALWVVLGIIASLSGWRGYIAVIPILTAVATGVGASWIGRAVFKEGSRWFSYFFIFCFIVIASLGYFVTNAKIRPLDPTRLDEGRSNQRSLDMLEFLKKNYSGAVTVDYLTWLSEDAALGRLKMLAGQYLEYLPKGSEEVIKDNTGIYVSDEETAHQLCLKYGVDLVIARQHLFSLLFRQVRSGDGVPIQQSLLYRMLLRSPLKHFELIYDSDPASPLPFVVVYKVRKN